MEQQSFPVGKKTNQRSKITMPLKLHKQKEENILFSHELKRGDVFIFNHSPQMVWIRTEFNLTEIGACASMGGGLSKFSEIPCSVTLLPTGTLLEVVQ